MWSEKDFYKLRTEKHPCQPFISQVVLIVVGIELIVMRTKVRTGTRMKKEDENRMKKSMKSMNRMNGMRMIIEDDIEVENEIKTRISSWCLLRRIQDELSKPGNNWLYEG